MAGAVKRLSKVAREFNVGIHTIVEFLAEKGHEIDGRPNTRIDNDIYDILLEEYMPDKAAKEKSERLKEDRIDRQTVILKDNNEVVFEDPNKDKKEEVERISAEPEKPEDVKTEEEVPQPEPQANPEPAPETNEEKEEEKEEEKPAPESPQEGPKVLGKIELPSTRKKTDKKKAKEEPKPPEKEVKKEEKPVVEEKDQESELIVAKADKLSGPTVVGKIELPKKETKKADKKPQKKPVGSSTGGVDSDPTRRKRRRRITKTDGQGGSGRNQRSRKAPPKPELTEEEINKQVRETLERLQGTKKQSGQKRRKAKREVKAREQEEIAAQEASQTKVLELTEFVTVNELASLMDTDVSQVISSYMSLGQMVSINQRLDAESLAIVAEEFGYEVKFIDTGIEAELPEEEQDEEKDLKPRPPIVTVMGHVDHGKTSLLDHVRKANVIAGEAGGITQHIGAYMVTLEKGQEITFLDTPGHEAFTAMRARGTQVTDLAIIVIAADDSVMPQTVEAINHAQAAEVPMIFAFNKIDRPEANADKIREELSQMDILVEDWGGKFQSQEISAKTGQGIDDLLEKVLLEAELMELKANPAKLSSGTVIEAELDKGRGYVSTLLVQNGTLDVGDIILAGQYYGKVKAMYNERGQKVMKAGPSQAVSMLGFNGAPTAGDVFREFSDEREAKQIALRREQLIREQGIRTKKHVTLDEIGRRLMVGDFHELNIIVKGDVDGSVEALADSLMKLSTEKVVVNIIHKSVGQISESDVLLASASDAIIIGFQVRPSVSARKLAEKEEIDIRLYSIIYKAIEEVQDAMEGMLKPKIEEQIVGNLEVRETFKISKVGTIAGCYVTDGKIARSTSVRIIRDGVVVYTGKLGSLKRFKDDVKEVSAGYECGLNIENFNDIKVGDVIEGYEEVEIAQKL
jgi:translation initiation factor IF-2